MPAPTLVVRAQPDASVSAPTLAAAAPALTATAPPARAAAAARPVYPLSVVAGGVVDRAELKRVVKRDAVVAAHYATFNVDAAKVVRNPKPRAVHVSYRKGDQIFWTARKVMLASNETLLSDGVNEMRTRCANRISDVAMLPVASDEPTEELLNAELAPEAPSLLLAGEGDGGSGRAVSMGGAGGGSGAAVGISGAGGGDMSSSRSQGRSAAVSAAGAAPGPSSNGWTNVGLQLGDVANAGNANNGAANNGVANNGVANNGAANNGANPGTDSKPQAGAPGPAGKPDNAIKPDTGALANGSGPAAGSAPASGGGPGGGAPGASAPGTGSAPGNSGAPASAGLPNHMTIPSSPSMGSNPIVLVPVAQSSRPGDLLVKPSKPPVVEPGDAAFLPSAGPIKPDLAVTERPPLWQPDTLPGKLPPAASSDSADVPEPATLVMVVSALALLGALRRRRRRGTGAAAARDVPH